MMMKLKEMLERAETWPPEAQEEAANALLAIEAEYAAPPALSDGDIAALERSAEDIRHDRFADGARVAELFGRYRRQ